MKKITAILVITMIITLFFSGCNANTTGNPENQVNKINISYVKLPLNIPSIIEKNEALFEEEFNKDDIEVLFPEITQGSKMTEALAAGSLDFCNALGGTSALLAAANGVDLKIIGIYSRAPKAFTLMTNDSSVITVDDLKGKKIVGPKGTILHQLLLASLEKSNISINDIEFINMGIPEGISAMMSGNADAALVAGPAVFQALENNAHIITTGEGLLDATIVIAVRGDFLRNHPDLVERYMRVHQNSLEYMESNPEKTSSMAAEETGISVDEVIIMQEWYDFNPAITGKDIKELEKTQDFLQNNDMLSKTIDINTIIQDMSL